MAVQAVVIADSSPSRLTNAFSKKAEMLEHSLAPTRKNIGTKPPRW
jgi:hypothetical protein